MIDTAVVIKDPNPLDQRVKLLEDRLRVNTYVMVVVCVMTLLIGLFVWLR
jgi:hypothetical protein